MPPIEPTTLPIVLAAQVPRIGMQVSMGYLRFLTQRRRGVRTFRQILLEAGMPRGFASRLASVYEEAGSLRNLLTQGIRLRP